MLYIFALVDLCKIQNIMDYTENNILNIDNLLANEQTVSVHKYGFYLCLGG